MPDLEAVLADNLADWRAAWNIGSFGAIAEFHQDEGEAPIVDEPHCRATARGGIRLDRLEGVTALAWEVPSKARHRWQHGVALCLPAIEAERPARPVLTELGADADAIRDRDREGVLFDMGLAQRNIDFCVRTADPELIALLRAEIGKPVGDPGSPVMPAILTSHPHRIAISAIGRCEVFQKIGGAETGGVSPAGPHTHVLPKLLASGRTHSANVPIPEGLLPVASLHPAGPVSGPMGEDRDFDAAHFAAFQTLLEAWGPEGYMAAKRDVWRALDAGEGPVAAPAINGRIARAAIRNALRQRARDGRPAPTLAAWQEAFGARAEADGDND